MKCATCSNPITNIHLTAVGQDFCSDVCHLRFWKDEMPNLGGKWITDKSIARVDGLDGEVRKEEYHKICRFVMNNMGDSVFFSRLREKLREEDEE